MKPVLGVIAMISWILYLSYPRRKKEKLFLLILVIFGLSYLLTGWFYSGNSEYYMDYFLRWGADCLSAFLLGLTLPKIKQYTLIQRFLPILCNVITPIMILTILRFQVLNMEMRTESGFNYQNMSYQLANMFAINFYSLFIYRNHKSIFHKLFLSIMMIAQAGFCAMSGGRGGFALMIVYALLFLYYMRKNKIISRQKVILIIISVLFVFIYVANYLNLWEISGFARSLQLSLDDGRKEIYDEIFNWIKQSPIWGYGIGGVWFTFGFYSHNILLDWFIEMGIIGLVTMFVLYIKTYKRINILIRASSFYFIIFIFFVYGVVMNMFTNYWIATSSNWLAFGCASSYLSYYYYRKKYEVFDL